jgi:hypothetical protein
LETRVSAILIACLALSLPGFLRAQDSGSPSGWTIYITNDNCPDYTWGFTEEETRQAFADIVRGHLDEMARTDHEPPENRDRYNMGVTQEALCFVERYPQRKAELVRRVKEGRVYVSPFLNNSLWGFQSVESAIRTLYPARRLEREWGIPLDVAEHIELPSLPWGMASILAGCGVRWLSVPFYDYDSTFAGLRNPPIFILEGPDGERLRVVMDPWASGKGSYAQGALLLRDPKLILNEWLPHYQQLGEEYPLRAILASGTHSDISPTSGAQARGFADAIINYGRQPGDHPKLVNATLPQFCLAVDEAEARKPFLRIVRGCFGHSWDVWPVSLAKYAADMRDGEREFLAAEALLTIAARTKPDIGPATRADREHAEWCWAMLADHAWNGTDEVNKQGNADLRRQWSQDLIRLSHKLLQQGWAALGLKENAQALTLFNSLSVPRADLVRVEAAPGTSTVAAGLRNLSTQMVEEDGRRVLYFLSPNVAGFSLMPCRLKLGAPSSLRGDKLRATATELESPNYRLKVDPQTGGMASLVYKPTGAELVAGSTGRALAQTIYFDGQEHTLTGVTSQAVALGSVLARLKVTGTLAGIDVTSFITVYADLDRVDFDIRIKKPVTTKEERLVHVFPVVRPGAVLRIETTGAVIRPGPQPEGDLLPGADPRRFAVQGFVDVSLPDGPGVTIAPLDAFVLRRDLDPITFEALGNDQDYKEVIPDQHGIREFRFRYSLRAHARGFDRSKTLTWSHSVASPFVPVLGSLPNEVFRGRTITIDPRRAIATCLKPADDRAAGGIVVRLWEVMGESGPLSVGVKGYSRAFRTDLLERDLQELPVVKETVTLELRAHGFGSVRLRQ